MRQLLRRFRGVAAVMAVLVVTLATAAVAAEKGVLDQSTGEQCCFAGIVGHSHTGDHMLGETFTAGLTGYLDTAELFIYQQGGIGGRYRVRLTGVAPNGTPDDNQLATAVLDVCRQGRLTSDPPSGVTFSPAPAVTAGQRYALVVEYAADSTGERVALWSGGANDLPNGFPWSRDRAAAVPAWVSIWGGKPLSLFTYVSASQPPSVTRHATTSTLSATPSTVKRRQRVQLEAALEDAAQPASVPTGPVTFVVDGSPRPPVALDAEGIARDAVSFDTVGGHSVTSAYCPAAGSEFISSEATAPITVSAAAWTTNTALSIEPDPTVAWQPATFGATVTNTEPGAPDLSGNVQFSEADGTPIGDPVPVDSTGHAELIAAAGAGTYVVRARYGGDGLHGPSAADADQQVTRGTTTTLMASSANPAIEGTPFIIGVAVEADAPSEGIPTGQVQFTIDDVPAGAPLDLDADGEVFVQVTALQVGSAVIGARYDGDDDYLPSQASFVQTVTGGGASTGTSGADASPPRGAATVPTPLTGSQLASALRIRSAIAARSRGAFRVGTVNTPRVRSLTLQILSRRSKAQGATRKPRIVVVGRGRLAGNVITARLTSAGRALVKRAKRLRVRLKFRAVDDTGNALTVEMARTLRAASARAGRSAVHLSGAPIARARLDMLADTFVAPGPRRLAELRLRGGVRTSSNRDRNVVVRGRVGE
jgi:hypothetical protein